jgi:acyl-CoA synthetase (AMP-forming)/AMP-acid ligase II
MAMQFAPVRSAPTGRPDLMIRGEPPIFAVEVERILTAHPAVRDAAVIEIPGAELGQRVEGFVQLECGVRRGVVDELLASVAILLADYKVPESLEVVQEIPSDHLGKVDSTLLVELILGRGSVKAREHGRRLGRTNVPHSPSIARRAHRSGR